MSVVTTRLQVWCEDQSGTRGSSFVNELVNKGTVWKVTEGLPLAEACLDWRIPCAFLDSALICSNTSSPSCLPEDAGMLRIPSVLGVPLIEGWGTNQASPGMCEILIKLIPKRWNKGKQGSSFWLSSEIFEPSSYGAEHQWVGRLVANSLGRGFTVLSRAMGLTFGLLKDPWCLCLAWDGSHDLHSMMALWVWTHPS